jgi:hypothetical protein
MSHEINWLSRDDQLAFRGDQLAVKRSAVSRWSIGCLAVIIWLSRGDQLAVSWWLIGCLVVINWLSDRSACCLVVIHWLFVVINWLFCGDRLAVSWLSIGRRVVR